ncbi:MAG: EAL domain-containing protein [Nitrosomonadales bacterium]|nr:EAL domain-containing protein [Nitrosomonadales bacterium]
MPHWWRRAGIKNKGRGLVHTDVLPVLYDFAVTIGNEISLKPLLTRTLQRLLYFTSFPAGFICLDVPADDGLGGEVLVQIDAAVGDYDLIGLIGKQLALPKALLCGGATVRETARPELLSALTNMHTRYTTYLKLPIDGRGVIVLVAPKIPETELPLTQMFQPAMALLAKAILLCRNHDDYTGGLIAERNLLAGVFESSYSGVMLTDTQVRIVEVNPAFTRITGYTLDEVRGQNPHMLASGRHDLDFFKEMWSSLATHGHWEGEIWNRRKNGEVYPEWLNINQVRNKSGVLTNYVAIFSDISERKQAEAKIHQLAFYDQLTDLPNRRLLMDRLQQELAVSARSGEYGGVVFLDLDNFKSINDTKGHDVGDLLLGEVAKRLKECVRDGDTVARLGGDEFVVVLKSLSAHINEAATQAELVAEKIHAALVRPYQIKAHAHHTSSSIGIVLFKGHQESLDDLLKHADTAMYQAKTAGRNAIRFYDPTMQAALEARTELEADMRQALEKQQFCLYYQIQVDNRHRPLGAEVLLRWEHPERGLVSPVQFIALAEETGLIVPIGLWVQKTACEQLKLWQQNELTRGLTLSVNVSAKQFRQADFVAQVRKILLESGANSTQLKLELTESAVLENVEDTIGKMREIKALGVGFAMDDFGTGYSSLQYLKRLPLDQIKIDQSFVSDIATDPNDAAIVKTIIAMTQALGLDVIAEGVETLAQREFLDKHGCHAFQGYLFGRPVPLDQFEAMLRGKQVSLRHSSALP